MDLVYRPRRLRRTAPIRGMVRETELSPRQLIYPIFVTDGKSVRDPIESMPSSIEAKEVMERASKENINAYVEGPLAFDNAVSPEAAKIKKITNDVAGKADILLVPNLETGNALSKIMVYFMGACAAGFIVGGKVPVVVTSRADNSASRIASIAASIIAAQ